MSTFIQHFEGRARRRKVLLNYKESDSEDSENDSGGMDVVHDSEEDQLNGISRSTDGYRKPHHCKTCPRSFYAPASLISHRNSCSGFKNRMTMEFTMPPEAERRSSRIADKSESNRKVDDMTVPIGADCIVDDLPLDRYPSTRAGIPQAIRQESATGDEKYKCSNCPMRFNCMFPLTRHRHICDQLKAHAERRAIYKESIRMNYSKASGRDRSSNQNVSSHVSPARSTSPTTNDSFSSPSSKLGTEPPATSTVIVKTPSMSDTTCQMCSKVLSSEACLEDHIRLHTGEKPFACPHCPVRFHSNIYLYQHRRLNKNCRVKKIRKKKISLKPKAVGNLKTVHHTGNY